MAGAGEVATASAGAADEGARRADVRAEPRDGDLYRIDGGTVNEGWFAVLDQVIEVAEQLGVYVIIPFVNTFWRAAPRDSARTAAAQFGRRAILRRHVRHLRGYEHWGTTACAVVGQDPSSRSLLPRRRSRPSSAASPPCWSAN